MECNKDEAARAKEIAEKKFLAKDIMGAKRFALKAQTLFPGLEGIPKMLSTLDVYISAENKISGEADWYGILGVDQKADDETVRKQYRKLALMLHPDKNKSIGADDAFKLISQAWALLSDKAKRVAYDQKRNSTMSQKISNTSANGSAASGANSTKTTTSKAKPPKSTTCAGSSTHKPEVNSTKPRNSRAKPPKTAPPKGHSSTPASSQKAGVNSTKNTESSASPPMCTTSAGHSTAASTCKPGVNSTKTRNSRAKPPKIATPAGDSSGTPASTQKPEVNSTKNTESRARPPKCTTSAGHPTPASTCEPGVNSTKSTGSGTSPPKCTIPAGHSTKNTESSAGPLKSTTPAGHSTHKTEINSTKNTESSTSPLKSTIRADHSTPSSQMQNSNTFFWTACHRCKKDYKFLRFYLNHKLQCYDCHEPFLAVETTLPPNGLKSPKSLQQQKKSIKQKATKKTSNPKKKSSASQNAGTGGLNGSDTQNQSKFDWATFSRTTGASAAAQAATMVQQVFHTLKRGFEEVHATAMEREELWRKNRRSPRKMNGDSSVSSNIDDKMSKHHAKDTERTSKKPKRK
ncbi:J protein JJJ2-like [Humulus lupulus]|uniref:J protein JJJ2-like n=1 Tax=Humulus lupulus TaxID=3486 RepID=UPI002B408058|nr:J protein JJJ2-like [Humulus lupulus]XP_062112929.1 J protein JJJ2-like [Humulus lupulus]